LTVGAPVTVYVEWDLKFEQWVAKSCTGASGFKLTADSNLHVAGLPLDCTEDSVMEFFSRHGKVARVKLLDPGQLRGEAMVHMGTEADALHVMGALDCTFPEWSQTTPLVIETAAQFTAKRLNQDASLSAEIEVTTESPPKMLEFMERAQLPDQLKPWLAKFPPAAQSLIFERFDAEYTTAAMNNIHMEGDAVMTLANKVILSLAKQVMHELNGQRSQPPQKLQSFANRWSLDKSTMHFMATLPTVVQDLLIERFTSRSENPKSGGEQQGEDMNDVSMVPFDADHTRLYVAGVPSRITKEQLYSAFNDYGFVTFCRMLPSVTWGFKTAIIRVEDAQQADLCVRGLHGNSDVFPNMSAPLEVCVATPLRELENANDWLFIQNLPDSITEDALRLVLSEHGRVKRLELKGKGQWMGVAAKACMKSVEEAAMCVECLDLETPPGINQQIKVGFDYWMSNATVVSPQVKLHGQAVRDLGKALLLETGYIGLTKYKKKPPGPPAPKKEPATKPTQPGGPPPAALLKLQQKTAGGAGVVPKSSSPFGKDNAS